MDKETAAFILFALAAVTAFIDAVREDWVPKVKKLALAVGFAATGLLVVFTDFLGK